MRHLRTPLTATLAALVLAAPACGGDDDDDGNGGGGQTGPAATSASSMDCLELSTLSPEVYDSSGSGVEKGVEPLLTEGAKGAEILIGELGAVVIEYPDEQAANAGLREAKGSKTLAKYVDPARISLIEKTLLIDYAKDPRVKRVVEGCARNPDQPPPT